MRGLKRIVIGLVGVVVALSAISAIAVGLIPQGVWKQEMEKAASDAIGHPVSIGGKVNVTLFPGISASVSDVSIAAAEGFAEPKLAQIGRLRAGVALFPLFSGRVRVEEFILEDAQIWIERRANGHLNWAPANAAQSEPDGPLRAPGKGDLALAPGTLQFRNVSIDYRDAVAEEARMLTVETGRLSLADFQSDLSLDVTGALDDVALELALEAGPPSLFLDGKEIAASARFQSDLGSIRFDGAVPAGSDFALSGALEGDIGDVAALLGFLRLRIEGADAVRSAKGKASLALAPGAINLTEVEADLAGSFLKARYEGDAAFGSALSANGKATLSISDLPALAQIARVNVEGVKAVQSVAATTHVAVSGNVIRLTEIVATLSGDALSARYEGSADFSDQLRYDGRVSFASDNLASLRQAAGIAAEDLPVDLTSARLEGTARGRGDQVSIENATVSLRGPDLEIAVLGRAAFDQALSFTGDATITSGNVRALAVSAGVSLPEGQDIYQNLLIKGRADGTLDRMAISGMRLELDDLFADGSGTLMLNGERPALSGSFTSGPLDVTPYAPPSTTQKNKGAVGPWSEEPFDLGFLDAVNLDLKFTAPSFTYGTVALQRTMMEIGVENGAARVDITELNGFNGKGSGKINLVATRDAMEWEGTFSLATIAAQELLSSIAQFERFSAIGGTEITISAQGLSQAAIMRSLSGNGQFSFTDGQIKGVDFARLGGSFNQLLAGQLDLTAFGPDQLTQFQDAAGTFTIADGVTEIQDFVINTEAMQIPISGALDLGAQRFALTLEPTLLKDVKGIDPRATNLPIPIRIGGGFGSVTIGLDAQKLQANLAARAKAELTGRVGDELDKRLGNNPLGAIARDALAGASASTPSSGGAPSSGARQDPAPAPTVEEAGRGVLAKALQDRLKRPAPVTPTDDDAGSDETEDQTNSASGPPQRSREQLAREAMGAALGGIFARTPPKPEDKKQSPETETVEESSASDNDGG
jgi:AsmA protein